MFCPWCFERPDSISSLQNSVSILFPALQRVACGQASWNRPEGSPPSLICVLCPVSPRSPEPGVDRGLWRRGPGVEAWCWWSEWPVAGGIWGPLQFHQHPLFWHWRYWIISKYQEVQWWLKPSVLHVSEWNEMYSGDFSRTKFLWLNFYAGGKNCKTNCLFKAFVLLGFL